MRKGFLHVVEILLVSALVLLILQFSYAPKQVVDWQAVQLYTQANDILFSLDRKGVDWFNSTGVEKSVSSFVSNNTIFSLKVRNVMKPQIRVGCICSPAETTSLATAFQPFEINGQPVSFSVTRISSIAFSHDYDVIIINDSSITGYYDQARQFLGAGRGIVEFRHLDQSKMDSVQSGLFGMVFNTTAKTPGPSRMEFGSSDSSGPYYNIYKYFHNIPVYQNNFTAVSGWTTQSGSWTLNNGNYLGDSVAGPEAISYYNTQLQGNYSMRAWFSFAMGTAAKLILYRQDSSNYVSVVFNRSSGSVTVWENIGGTPANRGSASYALAAGAWYDARIITQEDRSLRIYINGSQVLASQPVSLPAASRIAFGVENGQARFDNMRVTFSEKHTFSPVLQNGENVWPADGRAEKIILLQKGTQLPACIVNDNIVEDQGRTAWLTYSDPVSNQDVGSMLRTLVVWAAGEENEVVKNDVKNVPVITSIYRTYDQDMYQPVEVVLTMGRLYG